MADEPVHELIIVRRQEEEEHAAHSSAWKVAHADFMTAMMAFFLIMWLINVTDDEARKGISQYFNPIHLSQGSTDLKGLNAPDPSNTAKSGKKGPDQPAGSPINPVQLTAGAGSPPDAKALTNTGAAAASPSVAAGGAPAPATAGAAPGGGTGTAAGAGAALAAGSPGQGNASDSAFQDPYAALAKLNNDAAKSGPTSSDVVTGDPRAVGAPGGAAARDPFDPIYWQLSQLPAARTDNPGQPGTADSPPAASVVPDAAAPAPSVASPAKSIAAADAGEPGVAPPKTGTQPEAAAVPDLSAPAADASADAVSAAKAIAAQVAKSTQPIMAAGAAPQLTVKATSEGTLISLTDDAGFSMFPVGSAGADPKVVALMVKIADALASQPGQVVIRGYTDGRPFHSPDNDNWRLSAARAHVAYELLTSAGLPESRVVSIEGHADRDLLNPADPYAAENRRIEILLKVNG